MIHSNLSSEQKLHVESHRYVHLGIQAMTVLARDITDQLVWSEIRNQIVVLVLVFQILPEAIWEFIFCSWGPNFEYSISNILKLYALFKYTLFQAQMAVEK
jgi:hypothetical protein